MWRGSGRSGASREGPEECARSDLRIGLLAEHATELIVELDARGRLFYVSPSSRELLGYEPAELREIGALPLIHPDDREAVEREFTRAFASESVVYSEHRARHRDGGYRWFADTGRTFRTESGELRFLVMSRDISEHRRVEQQLERQLSVEQQLAELSHRFLAADPDDLDAAVRANLPLAAGLAGADRTFLIVVGGTPPAIRAAFRWAAPGLASPEPDTPPDAARRYRYARRHLMRGEIYSASRPSELPPEAAAERADLERRGVRSILVIPLRLGAAIIGWQSFECVHAERTWSERELTRVRLAGEIFAAALHRKLAAHALAAQLAAEKRIAELSRRFLGVAATGIVPAIRDALADAAALADADRAYLLSFARGCEEPFETFEWCAAGVTRATPRSLPWASARMLAGETLHVARVDDLPAEAALERADMLGRGVRSLLGIPVFSGRELIGFLGLEAMRASKRWSEQEITLLRMVGELFTSALRRKRVEAALEESQAQLLTARKMEAVGRLAGGVAHEFNNLLSVILGFSRPLLRELAPDDPVRADVAEIDAAAERAAGLTRQLLAVGRRQPIERRPVDLNATLDEIEEMLRRLLGDDVELVIDRAPDLGRVLGDPAHFEQLAFNLAVNARDAMADGGTFFLSTRDRSIDETERLRLGLPRPGRYVALTARDTGDGMDERTRSRIFEPFYTTKEPGRGTGLGLSIVYTIVEQCAGAIRVEAEPGKGSTFELYFPRLEEGA